MVKSLVTSETGLEQRYQQEEKTKGKKKLSQRKEKMS